MSTTLSEAQFSALMATLTAGTRTAPVLRQTTIPKLSTPLTKENWHFDRINLASLMSTHESSWWTTTSDGGENGPSATCPLVAITQNLSEPLRKLISGQNSTIAAWEVLIAECAGNDLLSKRTALANCIAHNFSGDIKNAFVEHERLCSGLLAAWGGTIATKTLAQFLATLRLEKLYSMDTKIQLTKDNFSFDNLKSAILANPSVLAKPGGVNQVLGNVVQPGCPHGFCPTKPKQYCYKCKPCHLCVAAKRDETFHFPLGNYCSAEKPGVYHVPGSTAGGRVTSTGGAHMVVQGVVDSGAFKTLSPNKDVIDFYSSEINTLSTASGDPMTLFGSGTIPFWNRLGQAAQITCSYVPELTHTLISVSQLDLKGFTSIFYRGKYLVFRHDSLDNFISEHESQAIMEGSLGSDHLYSVNLAIRKSGTNSDQCAGLVMPVTQTVDGAAVNELGAGRVSDSEAISLPTVLNTVPPLDIPSGNQINTSISAYLDLHRRLGHVSFDTIKKTIPLVSGILALENASIRCADCKVAKSIQKPHPKLRSSPLSSKVGELIHADFYIMSTATMHGEILSLELIDDFSREVFVYLLQNRSSENVLACFQDMSQKLQDRNPELVAPSRVVQRFRSDNDKGFEGVFGDYLKRNRIAHELSAFYDHPQNGVAERMNLSLGNMERSLREYACLPIQLWGYSYMHAAYLKNRMYSSSNISDGSHATPIEKGGRSIPDLSQIAIWGCAAVVHVHKETRLKGYAHGTKCRYLGESSFHKAGIFIECATNKIIYSRDVDFFSDWRTNATCAIGFDISFEEFEPVADRDFIPDEQILLDNPFDLLENEDLAIIANDSSDDEFFSGDDSNNSSVNGDDVDIPVLSMPAHLLAPENIDGNINQQAILGDLNGGRVTRSRVSANHAVLVVSDKPSLILEPPARYSKIAGRSDSEAWYSACDREINGLLDNHFGELIPRPPGSKVIRTLFVLSKKVDGSAKARWVAADIQKAGEPAIYSPVALDDTFKMFCAVVAQEDLECEVVDVNQAFLKAFVDSDQIFVTQPEGYVIAGKESWVYRLSKSLYGLQQAPKLWNLELNGFLCSLGFAKSLADNCLYTRIQDGLKMLIVLHVDDLSIACKSRTQIVTFKKLMHSKYGIKELGPINRFLMYQVQRDRSKGTIVLHQNDYIREILEMANMSSCHGSTSKGSIIKTGFSADDLPKTTEEQEEMDKFPFRRLTGALQQLACHTRPDIAYEVATLSKFNNKFGQKHKEAMRQLLKYLKHTSNLGLTFTRTEDFKIQGWADASYNSCKDTGRTCGGYIFTFGSGATSWKSRWFSQVYPSSTESEFASLFLACSKAVWIRKALVSFGYEMNSPIPIHEDNQSAIKYALSKECGGRMQHMDPKFFWIREAVEQKLVELFYIHTSENLADIMTKSLRGASLDKFRTKMGLSPLDYVTD